MKVFLYRKNNAARFIAIVLAFIMLAVPFFAHAGFKGDSKAEEGGDGGGKHTYNATVEVKFKEKVNTLKIVEGNDNNLEIKTNSNSAPSITEYKYEYDKDYLDIWVNSVTENISGEIETTNNNITYWAQLNDCEVYYKENTPNAEYVKWESGKKVQINASDDGMSYIGFYIKVKVNVTDSSNSQGWYQYAYVYLAKVSFKDVDIGTVPSPSFKQTDDNEISDGNCYTTVKFKVDSNIINEKFKQGYLKSDDTFVAVNSTQTINNLETGIYTPCTRYYVTVTGDTTAYENENNTIKDFKGTPVKIDADAPDFDLYIVKKNGDGTEIATPVKKKNDGTFEKPYVNKGSSTFLRVVPNDGTGECASGIKEVSVSSTVLSAATVDSKSVYDADINSVSENTDITITVTDKAGNTTTKTMQYMSDTQAPEVSEQKAYLSDGSSDEELNSDIKWYKQGDKSIKLTAKITDDKYVDKVQLYIKSPADDDYKLYDDNSNTISLSGTNPTAMSATVTLDNTTYNATGEYSFYFKAFDGAGNEKSGAASTPFKLDNTAPDASLSYELRIKEADGSWGEWQKWSPVSDEYIVNKEGIAAGSVEYRIKVNAQDIHSGYDHSKSGKVAGSDNVESNSLTYIAGEDKDINEPKILSYGIKADDVQDSNPSKIKIRISDTAGNKTDIETGKIVAADKDIGFDGTTAKIYETDNPDNIIDFSSFVDGKDININKKYTIAIDAYSGYEITSAKLSATTYEAINGTNDLTIDGVVNNCEFDIAKGKYTANITYEVPGDLIYNNRNEKLQDIKLSVTDNRNANAATGTEDTAKISFKYDILYDMSLPRLDKCKILKGNAEEAIEDKWYQKADIAYNIVSESYITNIESGLSWISWEITGSEDNKSSKVDNLQGGTNYGATINIPESADIYGTKITFNAEDKAANGIYTENGANIAVIKVDKHAPKVTALTVNDRLNHEHTASYGVLPVVKAAVSDNLTLDKIVIEVTYPDGVVRGYTKTVGREGKDLTDSASYQIEQVNGKVLDGAYTARAYAVDKAGHKSPVSVNSFVIDATKPVVTSKIIEGTASPKTAVPYYYKDNVGIELTYADTNISADKVTVTDNGNAIGNIQWEPVSGTNGKYRAVIYVSDEGSHSIAINANDTSGNAAVESKQNFVIDKTKPQITAYINGTTVYSDSMGNMMLTGNTSVAMNISDATADTEDCYVQVQRSTPSEGAGNPAYVKTANNGMSFGEEGDYVVNFYTIDKAGNSSDVKTVRFRIDKTSPELSISGAAGGTSASASTVTFTMRETFWSDADATVAIYRKASDGTAEQLYKTLNFNPSAYQTSMSETLTETGVYRFEFEAGDNVGHHSELSQTLIIDRDAPVVTLTGVKDYDMTDGNVEFMVEITDDFYSSKKVNIKGTRTDKEGKVNKIDFGTFLQSTNPTVISKTFDEEGIYFITLETEDAAGNRHTNTLHFVIDNTAPVIGDLSKYDGKILTSFSWDENLDELVSDLTVCDVQMFLNGSEYDGVSDIEDGSYVLLIAATDEMGHKTEKEVTFELDTKAPVFIITGVEDGEVRNEDYVINVSLQLDEDTLESVVLNGVNISVRNNTATINVTEKGEYTLELKAHDAAGNEATETITFKYGEEKSLWWLWIVIACCVILAGTIIIIIAKKKKKEQ